MRQLVFISPKTLGLPFFVLFALCTLNLCANNGKLSVIVVDENETPLSGVNVYTTDLDFAAVTDEQGKVNVPSINSREEFNFSYIGYQTIKRDLFHLLYIESKVQMHPSAEAIEPIIVAGRRDDDPSTIAYAVDKITQQDIAFLQTQNSADALQQNGAVFVQKSQMGGGSPVLRGFEANRLLLVVDGVRMNNAIYRSGHLQNAITVDYSVLEQAEVIYGPGSLMYGSDALGGVIHYRTREPDIFRNTSSEAFSGNYFVRYASANQENTGHIDFTLSGQKWASLTSLNYSDFGDLRAGTKRPEAHPDFGKHHFYINRINGVDTPIENLNPDLQINTGYSQMDFSQKLRFQPNEALFFIANFQYSNSSNIPRYDQLTERSGNTLRFAEWYYGPQSRSLFSLKSKILTPNLLFDKGTLIAARQQIGEDRYDRRTEDDWRFASLVDVAVYSFTADFDKQLDERDIHLLSYGFDWSHNVVDAAGFRYNIEDGSTLFDINTRYPSNGSTLSSLGFYANYRLRTADSSLVYNAGIRYSENQLFVRFGAEDPITWPANYLEGIHSDNNALTWSTGLRYFMPSQWEFRALVATAFRTPNIDDLAKFREKNGFISVPNPELKPENALSGELSLVKTFGRIRQIGERRKGTALTIGVTGFYTRLKKCNCAAKTLSFLVVALFLLLKAIHCGYRPTSTRMRPISMVFLETSLWILMENSAFDPVLITPRGFGSI